LEFEKHNNFGKISEPSFLALKMNNQKVSVRQTTNLGHKHTNTHAHSHTQTHRHTLTQTYTIRARGREEII
jgi:hypothetical protein